MADSDLGIRIKRAREARGWSQEELANRLAEQRGGKRVSVRSVGSWERGEAAPRSALGALEVVLAPYFTVDGVPPPPPADPLERELWDLMTAENVPAPKRLAPADAWKVIEEYRRAKRTAERA